MKHASGWLRQVEIALWVVGISLLGGASGATFERWNDQARQERALFQRGPAVSAGAEAGSTAVEPGQAVVVEDPAVQAGSAQAGSAPRVETKRRGAAAGATAFARIEIPRIGIAAIVKEGADERTLARAVGLVPESARPGQAGNTVLAGHRDTFFRPLSRIRVNDRIRLIVPPHTYEYRVESVRVVAPEETSVLESRGAEELTLVTCYPFRFVGPAPERFIVNAARMN